MKFAFLTARPTLMMCPDHDCISMGGAEPRPVTASLRLHAKDISFINGAGPIHLFVSKLKVDVGVPGLLLRLPFHPALKHLPGTSNVSQHLLHVCVFVPLTKSSKNICHCQNDLGG